MDKSLYKFEHILGIKIPQLFPPGFIGQKINLYAPVLQGIFHLLKCKELPKIADFGVSGAGKNVVLVPEYRPHADSFRLTARIYAYHAQHAALFQNFPLPARHG